MPRETFDIEDFSKGIMLNIDPANIPAGGCLWSSDVDGRFADGHLAGRKGDIVRSSGGGEDARKVAWIEQADGTMDLLRYTEGGSLVIQRDMYGSVAETALISGTAGTASIEVANKQAHCGRGSLTPQRVGVVDTGQFGGAAPGLTCEDATLISPTTIPLLYKTFVSGSYMYGIAWQGQKLYRIHTTTGVVDYSSEQFISTQGLCLDGSSLYLFDGGAGANGVLYKITVSTMMFAERYTLDAIGVYYSAGVYVDSSTKAGWISDIEATNNYIVFAAWRDPLYTSGLITAGFNASTGNYLSAVAKSSLISGGTFSTNTIRFSIVGTTAAGDIDENFAWGSHKRSLFRIGDSSGIGWCVDMRSKVHKASADTAVAPGYVVIFVEETHLAGDDITNVNQSTCRVRALRTSGVTETSIAYIVHGIVEVALDTYDNGDWGTHFSTKDACQSWGSLAATDFTIANSAFDGSGWKTSTFPARAKDDWMVNSSICMLSVAVGVTTWLLTSEDTEEADPYWEDSFYAHASVGKLYSAKAISSLIVVAYIGISPVAVLLETEAAHPSDFVANKREYYRISFLFGNQEGPLSSTVWDLATVASSSMKITLRVAALSLVGITHINVYRAESASSLERPEGYYRLVESVSLEQYWSVDNSVESTWGTAYVSTIYDTGVIGASYEANTGIAETLDSQDVRYAVAAMLLGYHFVSQCTLPGVTDALRIVVRSKRNAPDMFDWTNDYLVLPKKPLALVAWNGMLFAFADSEVYRIDPELLVIAEVYAGVGTIDENTVLAIKQGLFTAHTSGFYQFSGEGFVQIAGPILSDEHLTMSYPTVSWEDAMANPGRKSVVFIPDFQAILIASVRESVVIDVFVFMLYRPAWFYWVMDKPAFSTRGLLIAGAHGECYLSTEDDMRNIGTSATRKVWQWISPVLTLNERDQKKSWSGLTVFSSGVAPTVNVAIDDNLSSWAGFSMRYANSLCIKLDGIAGTTVRAISITYRRMIGKR